MQKRLANFLCLLLVMMGLAGCSFAPSDRSVIEAAGYDYWHTQLLHRESTTFLESLGLKECEGSDSWHISYYLLGREVLELEEVRDDEGIWNKYLTVCDISDKDYLAFKMIESARDVRVRREMDDTPIYIDGTWY